jgi:anion-transporting  ArsA/GET3 family ATPase
VSSGALDVVTTAAPGIRDLLVLGRVKQHETSRAADLIIVDAPAAGHAVSFLRSPAGLRDAVTTGPIATQAIDVIEMLGDPGRSRVMLVTLPEETPVNELIETAFAVEDEVGVQLGPVIVNALVPELTGLDGDVPSSTGVQLDAPLVEAMRDAASFRTTWVTRQRDQLDRLRTQLPLPLISLPSRFTTDLAPADLDVLVDALISGIGSLDEADH